MTMPSGISKIDLHIHTWHSDGAHSPGDILRRAADQEMTTLAFADHDNMRGAREALPIAAELNLELIPAIEITCRWDDCDTRQGDRDID
ncbi:MAG: PHP domain-containing protein, partial [Anaerolineae bacterium]|nr:PHP domain-containing protein [Anaerolineae bacterium]